MENVVTIPTRAARWTLEQSHQLIRLLDYDGPFMFQLAAHVIERDQPFLDDVAFYLRSGFRCQENRGKPIIVCAACKTIRVSDGSDGIVCAHGGWAAARVFDEFAKDSHGVPPIVFENFENL